ncbi:MAG: tetratricopeptide repeat protein [Candidatus Thorarchaeota archaeon]
MPLFGRKKDTEYEEAALLLTEGDADSAIAKLRELIERHPNHTNALTTLGVALIQSIEGQNHDSFVVEEAMAFLNRAADSNPKDPVPLFNKAVCLRNLGRLEEALEVFDQTLEREGRFALAILHKAEIHYELGNYEEAIELARLAIIRDPAVANTMSWVKDAMEKAGLLDEDGNPIDRPPKQPKMF